MLYRAIFLLTLVIPGVSGAEISYSEAVRKGELDGIPMHYINVQTRDHDTVDIRIDGRVDEPIWEEIPAFDNMLVSTPGTGEPGDFRTESRLLATERGLYVSGRLFQPPESLKMRMQKRDQQGDGDSYGFTIDTTGQGTFAYWFQVALGDSIMDGKVLPERRYSTDWDGPWHYKSAVFDEGWSVEIFFPWSMFAVPEVDGTRHIGFAISRLVSHKDQRYYWPGHTYSSPQFVTALNTMLLEDVKPRRLLSVIPYVSLSDDRARGESDTRIGADIVWKPSTAAELTLAVNPDFGAVEADNVVLNLTALETFFPEKRLFFQEGNEIFVTTPRANSGNPLREETNENFAVTSRRIFVTEHLAPPISMINTRRIGGFATQLELPAGVSLQNGEAERRTELLGAAKVTGNVGHLRYGMLAAFEDDVELLGRDTTGKEIDIRADGRDFAAARLSYEVSDSNRWAVGYLGTLVRGPVYDARTHGLDWHWGTGDGKWSADVQFMRSDVDGISGDGALVNIDYQRDSSIQHLFKLDYLDDEIQLNDLGFLQRNDYKGFKYIFRYAYPRFGDFIKSTRGAVTVKNRWNVTEGQRVDAGVYWRNTMVLPGRNTIRTALAYLPSRYEDRDSRGNGAYKAEDRIWWNIHLNTDATRMISWTVAAGGIKEDLGDWSSHYWIGFTARPHNSLVIDLDLKYKRRHGWLVYQGGRNFGAYDAIDWQPKVELNWFMAPGHQLRFSLQWAGVRADEDGFYAVPAGDGKLVEAARTRADHDFTVSLLTAQLRYKWEIAPLTDLYLVYNRGGTLPYRTEDSFDDLFSDVIDESTTDSFIVKLRYRFGN